MSSLSTAACERAAPVLTRPSPASQLTILGWLPGVIHAIFVAIVIPYNDKSGVRAVVVGGGGTTTVMRSDVRGFAGTAAPETASAGPLIVPIAPASAAGAGPVVVPVAPPASTAGAGRAAVPVAPPAAAASAGRAIEPVFAQAPAATSAVAVHHLSTPVAVTASA